MNELAAERARKIAVQVAVADVVNVGEPRVGGERLQIPEQQVDDCLERLLVRLLQQRAARRRQVLVLLPYEHAPVIVAVQAQPAFLQPLDRFRVARRVGAQGAAEVLLPRNRVGCAVDLCELQQLFVADVDQLRNRGLELLGVVLFGVVGRNDDAAAARFGTAGEHVLALALTFLDRRAGDLQSDAGDIRLVEHRRPQAFIEERARQLECRRA
jgi:hypothetical protein